MSLDKKKLGEEELKRALLMMKYDSRKTLSENIDEQSLPYPALYTSYVSSSDHRTAASVAGFESTPNGNCSEVMLVDGGLYNNMICNFCEGGYFDIKNEKYYEKETERGTWSLNEDKTIVTITMNNGITMSGSGDVIKNQIYKFMIDYFANSQGMSGDSFKLEFGSIRDRVKNVQYQGKKVQTSPEQTSPEQTKPKKQGESKYRACKGTDNDPFKKGCYEEDKKGPLHKVQTCIGVVSDGKFWSKTETALYNKTGKNSFTINDVDKICNIQTNPEPTTAVTPQNNNSTETEDLGSAIIMSTNTDF